MASPIHNLTPEAIAADPWGALRLICYDNPKAISQALTAMLGRPVPESPETLFQWLKDYARDNGNLDPLLEVAKTIPISGPPPERKKDFLGVDWGGVLEGAVNAVVGGIFGRGGGAPNDQHLQLIAAQQAQSQRMMNIILVALGVGLLLVVGVVIFMKK